MLFIDAIVDGTQHAKSQTDFYCRALTKGLLDVITVYFFFFGPKRNHYE